MGDAPANLGRHVSYRIALPLIGHNVPADASGTVICPICNKPSMRIFSDLTGGSRFHCSHCATNVDGVQLVARALDVPLKEAFTRLMAVANIPRLGTKEVFEEYETLLVRPVERIQRLIRQGRSDLTACSDSTWSDIRCILGLYSGSDGVTYRRCVSNVLSGTHTSDLTRAFRPHGVKLPYRYPKKLLTVPFCDTPGRPRTLAVFDDKGEYHTIPLEFVANDKDHESDGPEGGLCLMDKLPPRPRTVYAIEGPKYPLFLWSLRNQFYTTPLPIVGYLDTTKDAWQYLRVRDRIVFWSPELSAEVFIRAARCGMTAYVATEPQYPSKGSSTMLAHYSGVCSKLRLLSIDGWQRAVQNSAKVWHQAMSTWLLQMDFSDAVLAMTGASMTRDEIQLVLESVTGSQRRQLASIFQVSDQALMVTTGSSANVEQVWDGWFSISGGSRRRICDTIIHIEDLLVDPDNTQWLRGVLERKGELYPFERLREDLEENAAKVIDDIFVEAGVRPPYVRPGFQNSLYEIAMLFAEMAGRPHVKDRIRRVGYLSRRGLVFPKFTIHNGDIVADQNETIAYAVDTPGVDIRIPSQGDTFNPVEVFSASSTAACALATLSAIAANFMAQAAHQETQGIAVIGEGGTSGDVVVHQLANLLDLPVKVPERPDELDQSDVGHALPIVIDTREHGPAMIRKYVHDPKPKSLLLLVNNLNAWSHVTKAGWIVINGNSRMAPYNYRGAVCMFFYLLAALEAENYRITDMHSILRFLFRSFAPEQTDPGARSLLDVALEIVGGECNYRVATAADRCLFHFIKRWMSKRSHGEYPGLSDEKVFLSISQQNREIKEENRLSPDDPTPEISLKDAIALLRKAGRDPDYTPSRLYMSKRVWNQIIGAYMAAEAFYVPWDD